MHSMNDGTQHHNHHMEGKIFGIPLFMGTRQDCLDVLEKVVGVQQTPSSVFCVFTPNTEQIMLAKRVPSFHTALCQADVNLPDSIGVVWALRQLSQHAEAAHNRPERIAGREVVSALLSSAADHHWKVFFLGGRGASQSLAHHVHHTHPQLVVEFDPGAEDIAAETDLEKERVLSRLQKFRPHILFVAYGAPHQEQWILAHKDALHAAGIRLAMAVGGSFDVLSGTLPLPPALMVALGMEWLWRLVLQPWRLKRQLVLPLFVLEVLKEKQKR